VKMQLRDAVVASQRTGGTAASRFENSRERAKEGNETFRKQVVQARAKRWRANGRTLAAPKPRKRQA